MLQLRTVLMGLSIGYAWLSLSFYCVCFVHVISGYRHISIRRFLSILPKLMYLCFCLAIAWPMINLTIQLPRDVRVSFGLGDDTSASVIGDDE